MMDERITPEQSLQLITNMINKAKNRFGENGHLYLLWGWAVLICSLAQFILINVIKYEHHYIVWFSMWLVLIYQVIYVRRRKQKVVVRAYTDEIIEVVWITFVILMFLFGVLFGTVMGQDYYRFINPVFLALYGMPTVISGTILRFKPLVMGGICCWLLSIVSTFLPYDSQFLLLPLAVIAAWIIPGYLLRNKYQKSL